MAKSKKNKSSKFLWIVDAWMPRDAFKDLPYSTLFYLDDFDSASSRITQIMGMYEKIKLSLAHPDAEVPDVI